VRGELLFFNEETGHGFIRTEHGERVYVARDSFAAGHVPVGRCAGAVVEFALSAGTGEHDFEAVGVTRVPDAVVGRARLRSTRKTTR
jgi:cold shock CspA family protein